MFAGVGAQRKRLLGWRAAVEHAVDDDGLRLQAAGFAGVVAPRALEPCDVRAIDLPQARISNLIGTAAVRAPAAVTWREGGIRCRGENRRERDNSGETNPRTRHAGL